MPTLPEIARNRPSGETLIIEAPRRNGLVSAPKPWPNAISACGSGRSPGPGSPASQEDSASAP
ncbi:hypothetical protein [Mangrovicoccus ximenensis]|uniref:hypothetical protein n=1 Tax=Mangrovicoccus ximenensis TaxID=1911570 RepID=UPI000D3A2D30